MPRQPYKLPNVFVGCPYGGKFKFDQFKKALARIPFRFFYADTRLTTKHLLDILAQYVKAADFCLFDISTWNPNVALEIGLAEGFEAEYYILLDNKLSKGVPADIQGIQRIQYPSYQNMVEQLTTYLVREHTHPRNVWEALPSTKKNKRFMLAMAILAHFKDSRRLTQKDLTGLAKGTYLRTEDQEKVLAVLARLNLVGKIGSPGGAVLRKNLYKAEIRLRR